MEIKITKNGNNITKFGNQNTKHESTKATKNGFQDTYYGNMGSQIQPTEEQIQKLISLKTPTWNGTKLSRDTQLTQWSHDRSWPI
eukprot:Pgem_evm1s16863